jgi:hypothetical protein
MPQFRQVYWGRHMGRVKMTFTSRFIRSYSTVLVTASEGDEGNNTNPNFLFVGNANVRVENIAPVDGRVVFIVSVDWFEPLPIWTSLVIYSEEIPRFIRAPGA